MGGLSGTALALFMNRLSANEQAAPRPAGTLSFRNGKFRILQLTDCHLDFNGDYGNATEKRTLDLIRLLLERNKPDLVVLTGDIVTGQAKSMPRGLADAWGTVTAVFEEAQVPFAVTFGNHDHEEHSETGTEQLEMIQRSPWNLTFNDDDSIPGVGNCILPILGAGGQLARRLWLFDSNASSERRDLSDWGWIKFDQVEWFRKAACGHDVPALAFFHIPLPEYWELYKHPGTLGTMNEDPCSPKINTGLFAAFAEAGDVEGVFTGHDHDNDYIAEWKGITLAYGRKTGYGWYGSLEKGGRMIEMDEGKPGFTTWIVTKDGDLDIYSKPVDGGK